MAYVRGTTITGGRKEGANTKKASKPYFHNHVAVTTFALFIARSLCSINSSEATVSPSAQRLLCLQNRYKHTHTCMKLQLRPFLPASSSFLDKLRKSRECSFTLKTDKSSTLLKSKKRKEKNT